MPEMNIWEQRFSESLKRRGYAAFRPVKDDGIDFLALRHDLGTALRFQVKGSRLFGGGIHCDDCGSSVSGDGGGWFDLDVRKMERQSHMTDFYVLIWPRYGKRGRAELRNYIIVPTSELIRRCNSAEYPGRRISKGHYRPWLVVKFDKGSNLVLDLGRGSKAHWRELVGTDADFTEYYRNWASVDDAARSQRNLVQPASCA